MLLRSWHEIIEGAHAAAEPGILFWDTAKNMTPSDAYTDVGFGSVSTNPCGEIILSPYDSCRLNACKLNIIHIRSVDRSCRV